MSHYAKIVDNVVTEVIAAEQDFIDLHCEGTWVQTSYNTLGGVHYGQDGEFDSGIALRKNYAGIGYTYDEERDAFIPPQPYPSWTLNDDTCLWDCPVEEPAPIENEDGTITFHIWDEDNQDWLAFE